MKQLPPEQRPLVGSVGEQYRRKLLMTQLPAHDHTPKYAGNSKISVIFLATLLRSTLFSIFSFVYNFL